MIWAIVENEKTEATPNAKGTCPLCAGKVFSKCGEVNVWHWAHFNNENCDSWYEPESFWHKHWKMTFGKENSEIGILKDGKRHIADILTNEKVIIELQNSLIPKQVIREREDFYGERMLWLINGNDFKAKFQITDNDKNLQSINRHFEIIPESKSTEKQKYFYWQYARKSWGDVKRPVFIDFGENTLFWVRKGMGSSSGNGIYVSKEDFINKYGGNYEYYYKHFSNNTEV